MWFKDQKIYYKYRYKEWIAQGETALSSASSDFSLAKSTFQKFFCQFIKVIIRFVASNPISYCFTLEGIMLWFVDDYPLANNSILAY